MIEKSVEEWLEEAEVYHKERAYFLALENCDKAIEINPKNAKAWFIKGQVYYDINKFHDAVKCLDKASEFGFKKGEVQQIRKDAIAQMKNTYADNIKERGIFRFVGILVIFGGLVSIAYFILGLLDGIIEWSALIGAIISLITGIAWIQLRNKFQLIADYIEIN